MPSIHDVAAKAGVSTTTVSRTFRSPKLLNSVTHQRVMEAAQQLGYRPRGRGRAKVRTASSAPTGDTIGFQFFADRPEDALQSNAFYAPMLVGAQAEAADLGLNLLVHTTNRHSLTKELPKMILDGAIAGMLLVGTGADAATLSTFSRYVPRLVLLDQHDETRRFESVLSDGFDGAYQATRYLLSLGHTRIAFFLAESATSTFRDRLNGYLAALFEEGIIPRHEMVIGGEASDDWDLRRKRVEDLLRSPNRPTAVLSANDDYALTVLGVARRLGVQIPEDLSLIGFDDIPFAMHMDPPLTTIRVDKEMMGRLGVRRLHSRLAAGERPYPEPCGRYEVPVALIIRRSCLPLS